MIPWSKKKTAEYIAQSHNDPGYVSIFQELKLTEGFQNAPTLINHLKLREGARNYIFISFSF